MALQPAESPWRALLQTRGAHQQLPHGFIATTLLPRSIFSVTFHTQLVELPGFPASPCPRAQLDVLPVPAWH